MQVCFFSTFASQFGYAGYGFTFFFRILYFLKHDLCHISVFMQKVVYFLFNEVTNKLIYCYATR